MSIWWLESVPSAYMGTHLIFNTLLWITVSLLISTHAMTDYPEQYTNVTNLRILKLFQFTLSRLIYLSKILQLFQQKSSLPCNSAFINGRQPRVLNHKGKSRYSNCSWMSFILFNAENLLWFPEFWTHFLNWYANFNKHTTNSSSTASLKATSCMAAALAAVSASLNIFRKGLFPLAKSLWLNEEREANVLNQPGCGWAFSWTQVHPLTWCWPLGLLCERCCILCSFSPAPESELHHRHPLCWNWNQRGGLWVHPLEACLLLLTKQHTV